MSCARGSREPLKVLVHEWSDQSDPLTVHREGRTHLEQRETQGTEQAMTIAAILWVK